ncbi:MAG: Formate--tetrahydrofolate ligase [bacterium ADurb.Bin363]|nr:MAG: Formate--tetrahydrofolate ligase [bacterium ADurb.Bin363]
MLSDLEIAQKAKVKPVKEIGEELGILEEELELYGKYTGKISLDILERLKDRPPGKLIAVTAITPTPLGEGKTVTAIGLGQGLFRIGKKVCNTSRQPSKGPTFGIKGGACGGGYSQLLPMEQINLHFTGDTHAVETAHNLLAAMTDTSILLGNKFNIDPSNVLIRRCVDLNDRALRRIIIGLGGKENGVLRETGYDITVATETMAILALTTGLFDLRKRFARMVVGFTFDGRPVTAEDLRAAGAMTVLMKEAIKPNLVQTIENTPAIIHGGPFANVAHGNNSALADMVALKLADYVVTECGFGSDCGFEKLINVKCRLSGLKVNAVVVVASIRALKMHGGAYKVKPGVPLPEELVEKVNMPALEEGCTNLLKHIEIVKKHGLPVVVSVNRFTSDTEEEVEMVKRKALEGGADFAVQSQCWIKGSAGAIELAEAVVKACELPNNFHFLYDLDISIEEKIETIAKEIYGAEGVNFLPEARKKLKLYKKLGYDKMPVNMAKTHLSLSHDPNLKGVPRNFIIPVEDIRSSVGAGFLYPILGKMMTMPGLSSEPAAVHVDIDKEGNTVGLF